MEYEGHTVPRLRDTPEVQAQPSNSRPPGCSKPPPQLPTWEPMRPQPLRSYKPMARTWPTRPLHPTRPPPPPPVSAPQASPSVRFIPDRLRQSELLRQLEERNSRPAQPPAPRPYQLKPNGDQETFIESPVEKKEVPPPHAKQIKHTKRKLGKLYKQIRHSKKKHNSLVSN